MQCLTWQSPTDESDSREEWVWGLLFAGLKHTCHPLMTCLNPFAQICPWVHYPDEDLWPILIQWSIYVLREWEYWMSELLVLFPLNSLLEEPWYIEVPALVERSSWLLPTWSVLNLKWFCHQSPQWCWMLIDCLLVRSWTEGLTIKDDDFQHDLEEPMHSSDFDDSEEVLCADAVEVCTFLFHERWTWGRLWWMASRPIIGFLTSSTMRKWMKTLPVMKPWCSHHWRWWGSLTSLWWACEEQMIEGQSCHCSCVNEWLSKVLDIPEAVTDLYRRWGCWSWPPWCALLDVTWLILSWWPLNPWPWPEAKIEDTADEDDGCE